MKVEDFKITYSELQTREKQKTCFLMIQDAPKFIDKDSEKPMSDLIKWCMSKLTFEEQSAVYLPDFESLQYYKSDQN